MSQMLRNCHFGVICPPLPGHINPLADLGRELQRRQHQVTFFHVPDIEERVRSKGIDFWPIGESDHPPGSVSDFQAQMGQLSGLRALRFSLATVRRANAMLFRDAPEALEKAGVQALIIDQGEPAGATVAQRLDLPYISICCGAPGNSEPGVPPNSTPWSYSPSPLAYLRNQLGHLMFSWITYQIAADINQRRRQWHLKPYHRMEDSFSQLAQISQFPAALDFPRTALPGYFHYTGPLRDSVPSSVPFPYEQLDGRPLIYTSLGTVQNTKYSLFHTIAAACAGLDAKLVVSHGGGMTAEEANSLPGSPLVVSYAPQLELLSRARLTITHGGLNTVLDSLSNGVPLVVIPITYEQPGVAARLQWTGAAEMVSPQHLNVVGLRSVVERVLAGDNYATNAGRLQQAIQQAGGVRRAADIIEQAIATGQPVLAQ